MSDELALLAKRITLLADIPRVQAELRPDKVAMTFEGRATTYKELNERASQQANAFLREGLKPQARAAILAKNTDIFFELQFATVKSRVVLVAVNFRLAPPEVSFVVNDAAAEILFVGEEYYELIEGIEGELNTVKQFVALHGGHARWPSFEDWVANCSPEDPMLAADVHETAVQLYSSGTTGHPKGVEISHDNLMALIPVALEDWGTWKADDVSIVAMPLFHIAGSEWGIVGFYVGAHNVIMPEVDPGAILKAIEAYGVTQALFVPAVILFLLQHPDCATTDFSSLRNVIYGASPIPLDLVKRAVDMIGCDFAQVYGLTETTGAFTYLPPEDHDGTEKMKSCGKVMRGSEVRVVDEEMNERAIGEVGEIVIRSRQVMKGYWNQPEATAQANRGGWFHTGDAGYFDAEGYLYIHDRVKDMIISGGENIYPAEIESALFAHPAIADIAIIGVPDDKWGEAVKAVVVLKEGQSLELEEFIAYARARLAGYKIPRSLDLVAEMPRNPSGKILKRVLREPYWKGEERQVH